MHDEAHFEFVNVFQTLQTFDLHELVSINNKNKNNKYKSVAHSNPGLSVLVLNQRIHGGILALASACQM